MFCVYLLPSINRIYVFLYNFTIPSYRLASISVCNTVSPLLPSISSSVSNTNTTGFAFKPVLYIVSHRGEIRHGTVPLHLSFRSHFQLYSSAARPGLGEPQMYSCTQNISDLRRLDLHCFCDILTIHEAATVTTKIRICGYHKQKSP
jgi:hypothetical protein